jgi:hypothetical protein
MQGCTIPRAKKGELGRYLFSIKKYNIIHLRLKLSKVEDAIIAMVSNEHGYYYENEKSNILIRD